jgi:hypothetical protein
MRDRSLEVYLFYFRKKKEPWCISSVTMSVLFSERVYKPSLCKSNASVAARLLTAWNCVILEKATGICLFHTTCIVLIVSTRVRL